MDTWQHCRKKKKNMWRRHVRSSFSILLFHHASALFLWIDSSIWLWRRHLRFSSPTSPSLASLTPPRLHLDYLFFLPLVRLVRLESPLRHRITVASPMTMLSSHGPMVITVLLIHCFLFDYSWSCCNQNHCRFKTVAFFIFLQPLNGFMKKGSHFSPLMG